RTACRPPQQGTLLRGLRRVLAWTQYPWVEARRWHPCRRCNNWDPPAGGSKRYIRLARKRKGASSFFLPHKCPLLAQSGHTGCSASLSAVGGKADIQHRIAPIVSDANDP